MKPPLSYRAALALASILLGPDSLYGGTTIDSANKSAYGANIGWTDWSGGLGETASGAVIGAYVCYGYIYSANVGWINLGSGLPANRIRYQNNGTNDFGVNQDGLGNLRGYAYGANIGWVNFGINYPGNGQPAVDLETGQFSGYAWIANGGWINLNSGYGVQVDSLYDGNDLGLSYPYVDPSPGASPLVILGEYSPAGPLAASTTSSPDALPPAPSKRNSPRAN